MIGALRSPRLPPAGPAREGPIAAAIITLTLVALAGPGVGRSPGQVTRRSALDVSPGDPSASALGDAPGQTGTADPGRSGRVEQVIPVGPGPSYPRVPRGITRPPEAFGVPEGLGIEPLSATREAELPISGRLGIVPLDDLEGPPEGLTIDRAIDRVLRLNLELQAQQLEISKARADVLTAGLRGNPLVYADVSQVPYGGFDGTAGGPTQYDLNITVPIDLNGKRRRRVEAAERARDVTEALYQDAVRLQVDNLYTAWIDVLAALATIRFLESGLRDLEAQKRATEDLVRLGLMSRTEFNNVEILIDSTDLTLLEARETFDDAKRTLAAIIRIPLGAAETFPIRGGLRGLDLPPPPVDLLIEQALRTRPDLAAFRLGILRARAELRLAEADRIDDVFLLYQPYTAQDRLDRDDRIASSWAVGLTVPVPLFNRNQGNIARARHTASQTRAQLEALERQVILEVQRAEAAYAVTLATIRRLQAETLPAARENLELSLQRAGPDEPDAISALEAKRAFDEIARQYLDALVRHRRSMFRINTAVGARVFP